MLLGSIFKKFFPKLWRGCVLAEWEKMTPKSNDNEPRRVFELEYLESLPDYEMVNLNVHYTYRDTLLGSIFR